ncbi:MAG: MerR family transcriptional regulator [Acidobacteriota bacterium]
MRQTANLITTSAVARALQRSEGTVRNLERRGILTAVRTESGIRLFDRGQVEAVAAQRNAVVRSYDNEAS